MLRIVETRKASDNKRITINGSLILKLMWRRKIPLVGGGVVDLDSGRVIDIGFKFLLMRGNSL